MPLGGLYLSITALKNWAYDNKIIKPKAKASVPVISVGNITLGGTGKTPLVILLAKKLSAKGAGAVLTRGYRSRAEKANEPLILTKSSILNYSAEETGDEPYLIAGNTGSTVFVNQNRERSLEIAEALNPKWILLDDGMQRRSIHRDLEIVVLNSKLLGNRSGFPAGPLRETLHGLKRADLIVITKSPGTALGEAHQALIRRYSAAPLIEAEWQVHALCNDTAEVPLQQGEKVALFCGVGNPDSFFKTMEGLKAQIIKTTVLDDHRPMSEKELLSFCKEAADEGSLKIVCTEKDFVKIRKEFRKTLPIFYAKADLAITAGAEALENSLAALK